MSDSIKNKNIFIIDENKKSGEAKRKMAAIFAADVYYGVDQLGHGTQTGWANGAFPGGPGALWGYLGPNGPREWDKWGPS